MDLIIQPRTLSGMVTPPPSKSEAHRLVICAALAQGVSTLRNLSFSEDILATLRCVKALGARWEVLDGKSIRVEGVGEKRCQEVLPKLDCGESGSTLRFLIPIALTIAGGGVFTGHGRLMQRPQQPYFDLFTEKGIYFELNGDMLTVRGKLTAGEYRLPGNVSSQFFTGLVFALPLLGESSTILATTPVESADYISLTLDAMKKANVAVAWNSDSFAVSPQTYRPIEQTVENDWSQAAFWLAAKGLGNDISVCGMAESSLQGDRRFTEFAEILAREENVTLDVSQCPDLVPPLAALAAVRKGSCRIEGAARLRVKESDRLASVTAVLNAMGADVREEADALSICGVDSLSGGVSIGCCGDHRIAMMSAVAATRCRKPVLLKGADCVKKSYPDFWEVYQSLGGECHAV